MTATMKLREACDAFLRDVRARNLSESTLNGYQSLFRQLLAFAASESVEDISDLDRARIRKWREDWHVKPGTHETRLKLLSAFFRFAQHEGWIESSPVKHMKPPRRTATPTMPLTRDEMRRMLRTSENFPEERALLLLMRYSGLAIQDAATLPKDALSGTLLTLRRAKTGESVVVDLPEPAVEALAAISRPDRLHFFWTGKSKGVTVAKGWRTRLQRLAARAKVESFRPHRLRDTFDVELLLQGVAMQDVSVLLGHGSIKITERYYAPWSRARRERLVHIIREANSRDPILTETTARR